MRDLGALIQAVFLCLTVMVVWWAAIAYAPLVMAWMAKGWPW